MPLCWQKPRLEVCFVFVTSDAGEDPNAGSRAKDRQMRAAMSLFKKNDIKSCRSRRSKIYNGSRRVEAELKRGHCT